MDRGKNIRTLTQVTVAQLISDFLEKLGGTSGGGFHSNESLKQCVYSGIEKFPFAHIWIDTQSFVVLRKSTALCVNTRDVPPFGGTSGGGFNSNKSLNYCVYSGIEKFPLLIFGWISKVL